MERIKCIAWDFDGVLNRNKSNGRFHWLDALQERFGVNVSQFEDAVFGTSIDKEGFWPIMRGQEDILDRLQGWKEHVAFTGDVTEVLDFWFTSDSLPCAKMLALMERANAAGLRQIIATNNEDRRTRFIENEMGFSKRVEQVFSSARMKVAKPDEGFFREIAAALDLNAYEILLVDDHPDNVRAAQSAGWQGHLFPDDGHAELTEKLSIIL